MRDFQLRVVWERDVLDGNLEKLEGFMSKPDYWTKVPKLQQVLLEEQHQVMLFYLAILNRRINLFMEEDNGEED